MNLWEKKHAPVCVQEAASYAIRCWEVYCSLMDSPQNLVFM